MTTGFSTGEKSWCTKLNTAPTATTRRINLKSNLTAHSITPLLSVQRHFQSPFTGLSYVKDARRTVPDSHQGISQGRLYQLLNAGAHISRPVFGVLPAD